jgi:ABC-type antimicrobial peptide transport system permease subunit
LQSRRIANAARDRFHAISVERKLKHPAVVANVTDKRHHIRYGLQCSSEMSWKTQSQITSLLRDRHHIRAGQDDDFMVRNLADIADLADQAGSIMTTLLASIASVSLIVGSIGIMNIMLVSVTERTREIGIRMAIGATEGDVRSQFLTEAVVLSLMAERSE